MEDGYMKTWQECCDHFNVKPDHGLSLDQVKRNREKYGPNGESHYPAPRTEKFGQKFGQKIAKLCKNLIITLVFEKSANFLPTIGKKNRRKL
jgi:hypothetical protein